MSQESAIKSQVAKIEGREQLIIEYAAETRKSEKKEHLVNEDRFFIDPNHRALGVFDGMGGHKAGETASQIACDYVLAHLPEIPNGASVEQAQAILSEIFIEADKIVYKASVSGTEYTGMGTTGAVLKFHTDAEGKNWALIANIGDSRIYEISKNGALKQLTVDDDFLNQLKLKPQDKERIAQQIENARSLQDLADDPAKTCFLRRNLIGKCLGLGNVTPSISVSPVREGDSFLLISDGAHKSFSDKEFEDVVKDAFRQPLDYVAKKIIQMSLEKSRESREKNFRADPDDMSVIFLKLKKSA